MWLGVVERMSVSMTRAFLWGFPDVVKSVPRSDGFRRFLRRLDGLMLVKFEFKSLSRLSGLYEVDLGDGLAGGGWKLIFKCLVVG